MEKAFKRIYSRLGIENRENKRLFWIAFSFLAVYFGLVVNGQLINRGYDFFVISIIALAIALVVCYLAVWFFGGFEISSIIRLKNFKTVIFAFSVFILTFIVFYSWQRILYPGSFSPDSIEQYKQTQLGEFNDWHPVLHTWLFFGFPNLFSSAPELIITFQLVWFSLAIAYLFYVLYTDGCPKTFMVIAWLYIICNPNTALIMLYPWKDSAFTILATVFISHCVRIFRSNGKWLLKWSNVFIFSLFAFLANGVRHNAILLVAPMLVILFVLFKQSRKKVIAVSAIFLVLTLLLKFPIYSIADVGSPKHRTTEVMGLPMTVLADVYMNDRESLDEDAIEFLDSLATQERWEKYYTFGSFNSFKWSDGRIYDKIDEEGTLNILRYTFNAAKNSPEVAKKSVIELTKMVWSFDGGSGWTIGYGITKNEFSISSDYDSEGVEIINAYRKMSNGFITKYLFNYTGFIIVILLFFAVSRIGRMKLKALYTITPLMIYNFGTMLLLTGHDFRFFHLNFVLVIPLLYIMLNKDTFNDFKRHITA